MKTVGLGRFIRRRLACHYGPYCVCCKVWQKLSTLITH